MYAYGPARGRRGLALCALWLSATSCSGRADQPLELGEATAAQVNVVRLPARGDTYVRSLAPNQNQATDTLIRLPALGENRAVLFFDNDAIRSAVDGGSLVSASLQLNIDNASGWGTRGRPIALHRLGRASSELGATWNCAIDANVDNASADCSGTNVWSMGATSGSALPFASTASATATIVDNQKGTLSLDVTADVSAIVTRSWAGQGFLLKKVDEAQSGVVEFASRERGASGPRLLLRVASPTAGDAGVVSQTSVLGAADTTIRKGEPDTHYGSDRVLRVRASGRNRVLLRFDIEAVRTALGTGKLARAKLALNVVPSYFVWGPDKRVGAHALTEAWTETGATWNCANDTLPNDATDCATADLWTMNSTQSVPFREPASSTASIGDRQSGVVTFDVTTDLACALAGYRPLPGFLIKKEVESQTGRVDFSSRESKTPPQLVLDASAHGGVSVTAAQCGVMGGGTGSDAGTCQPSAARDTTCDGVDDDCDGRVDDDFETTETQCGVGACSAAGGRSCVNAAIVDSCVAQPPAASDATCDGVDDDCNGVVDDDYMPAATSCGAGACARFGSTACVAGQVQDGCVAGPPAAADTTCDGIDDDCDGKLDDDFVPAATRCGIGACGATGTQSCVAGHVLDSCAPRAAAASDATCDGIDDDCDGTADDDYLSRSTRCGVGACGRAGLTACVVGQEVDSCVAGAPATSDATCDGLDDDCDGVPDDEYTITPTRCGVGACGVRSCLDGQVVDSCLPLPAADAAASCDGVDDGCAANPAHCGVGGRSAALPRRPGGGQRPRARRGCSRQLVRRRGRRHQAGASGQA